ncbi:PREDICTED: 28S ribosomal protein S15, mitochondrial [Ceratosolen solmsi marchali]|uniref:Small ribosomal subunit protein uS15m n=1 Tax=Ceratosolen solmsi marchali TaxID=326594 RepID=A0AAJ6YLU7_9HYME|nr:PREDICTED: 28S ribosomal protein S15, mitochondrial [Ceratosolen solmsi marchali]
MNIIRRQFKNLSIISKNLIQNTYCTKYPTLPEKWVMPIKICSVEPQKSGDGGIDYKIAETDYIQHFDKSKELQNCNEILNKLCSVKYNRKKELVHVRRIKALELVQRHKLDRGSMESRIAAATVEIHRLQEHYNICKKDIQSKVFLKELIEKRRKWLKKLRLIDYSRFEFLLEKLNLTYHPPLEQDIRLTVKYSTKKLHEKRCDQIIQQKLDTYKAELQGQQKDFFKEKAEKLAFIRKEEIECGIVPTITELQIKEAEAKAASFV